MDDQVRLQFISEELAAGARKILETQRGLASASIYGMRPTGARIPTGNLMQSLTSGQTSIDSGSYNVHASLNYPVYIRFLDMKRYGNHKIYNRPIFGIFYKEVLGKIRYGFGRWLEDYTRNKLKISLQ